MADNSFNISINTKIYDNKILSDISGICILNKIKFDFFPKHLAASSIFFESLGYHLGVDGYINYDELEKLANNINDIVGLRKKRA